MTNGDGWITIAESKHHHEFSFLILMAIATVDFSHLCDRTDCRNPVHGPAGPRKLTSRVGISVGKHTEDGDM